MKKLLPISICVLLSPIVEAAPNLFKNASFETNTTGAAGANQANPGITFYTLPTGNTQIKDWTVIGNSVDYVNQYWQPSAGFWSVDLSGNAPGGVQQNLGNVAKGKYLLTFDMSGNPDGAPVTKSMLVSWMTGQETFTYVTGANTRPNMMYQGKGTTIDWRGGNLSISFATNTGAANNTPYGPVIDNVSLSAKPAPSPAAAIPMLVGLGSVVRRRLRRA